VWVCFAQKAKDDYAIVQEVKTTGLTNLRYANELIADYEKLYGTNLDLTLRTRFKPLKKEFLFKVGGAAGKECSERLFALCEPTADRSPKMGSEPTIDCFLERPTEPTVSA